MRTTTNLGLKVWNLSSDGFLPSDLEDNWDAIDADYTRARPADRVEILAAVPAAGNFDGRLVYLTAADGGFPTKTMIHYNGTVWKAVGPNEILASVPTLANYDGRLVLLSAANGGFSAWTLIRYQSGSWYQVNQGIEVSATVPVTNNYAGRVVILSAADGGFSAFEVIRYSGSAWKLVGPQPIPPGTELAYSAQTTDQTTTSTSVDGATLLTFGAATFENVKYYLHISIPNLRHSAGSTSINFKLREAAAGVANVIQIDVPTASVGVPVNLVVPFTYCR